MIPGGDLHLYPDWDAIRAPAQQHTADTDVSIVTSHRPDGLRPGIRAREFEDTLFVRALVNAWLALGRLDENDVREYVDEVTDRKPATQVYVDDPAVCFQGDFDAAYRQIATFKSFRETR